MAEKKTKTEAVNRRRSSSSGKSASSSKTSAAKTAVKKTTTASTKTAATKTTTTKSAAKPKTAAASKKNLTTPASHATSHAATAPTREAITETKNNEIFTKNMGGFGMQDYSFGDLNSYGSTKKDDPKKKKILFVAIIAAVILLLLGLGTAAIVKSFSGAKNPAAQRTNTLALVQKYLDKGQYDDAMKLLNDLLQADINDKEADELLDKAIEMKRLAESQAGAQGGANSPYSINIDTNEITNALREQNERNQETINQLLAQQRNNSSANDEFIAQQKAAEEQRKKEDTERKQKEEALAQKNKELKSKIDAVNEKVLAGKADLNTGNIDSALKNFDLAAKQLPLSEGEPAFSASKYSEIASALYNAALSEKDPARKEKLNSSAIQYVNKALAKDPNDATSHYIMGMNYIDSGDWEKAQKELADAVKNDPDNYLYYYNLGRAQYRLKNFTAARSSFESSIKYNKNFDPAYFNLGMTCHRLKLNKDALAAFRNAHQVNPQYARAYLEEARILNNDFNDAKGALAAYKKVIELDPVNTQALNECGTVYAGMGDYVQAENCYRRAMALLKPGDKDPITYYNLATALYNQNKLNDAETNAKTAYSQMSVLKGNADKAMVVYNYALIEDMLGNSDKAITLYKEVLVLDPDNAKTKTNLGKMFMNMNPPDADTALTFYLDAYKVSPSFELENNMGSAYLMKKDYGNAITYFQKAIKRSPKDNTVRFNLAQAYSGAGDFNNAKTTYLEILNADTSNWDSYIELAKVYMALKDTANAEAYLKILQQKNPTYKKAEVDKLLSATAAM